MPELDGVKDPDKAYDPQTNVTKVGLRLAQKLEQEGIGAVHSDKNYPAIEKSFNYYFSYKYSLKTLQEASSSHPDLKYYFDIHRDSQRREKRQFGSTGRIMRSFILSLEVKTRTGKKMNSLLHKFIKLSKPSFQGSPKARLPKLRKAMVCTIKIFQRTACLSRLVG